MFQLPVIHRISKFTQMKQQIDFEIRWINVLWVCFHILLHCHLLVWPTFLPFVQMLTYIPWWRMHWYGQRHCHVTFVFVGLLPSTFNSIICCQSKPSWQVTIIIDNRLNLPNKQWYLIGWRSIFDYKILLLLFGFQPISPLHIRNTCYYQVGHCTIKFFS
jgi:hypothetical protein